MAGACRSTSSGSRSSTALAVVAAVLLGGSASGFSPGATRRRVVVARMAAAESGESADAAVVAAAGGTRNDTLTREALGAMLAEVRDHYEKQVASGSAEEMARVQQRLFRMRVSDLPLNRCEVRPSEVHGRGIFATRDIAAGELVTLFPGDAMLTWPDGDLEKRVGGCEIKALFGQHVSNDEQTSASCFVRSPSARQYELPTALPEVTLLGDPQRDDDPAYLGHLANDGAAIAFEDEPSRKAYAAASAACANAAHVSLEGLHHATVATAPIKRGDEVLVSYGEPFWLSQSGFAAKDRKKATKAKSKERRLPAASAASKKKKKKAAGGFGA